MHDLDVFVERVLLHNNVVAPEQVAEAKKLASEFEGSNLIDGLIYVGALDANKARAIWTDYHKWSARQKQRAEQQKAAAAKPNRATDQIPTAPRVEFDDVPVAPLVPSAADASESAVIDVPKRFQKRDRRSTAILVRADSDRNSLNQYLRMARDAGASDLHIKPGCPPMIRRNRQLVRAGQPFTAEQTEMLLLNVLNDDQAGSLRQHQAIEFSYTIEGEGRYRGGITRQRLGWEGSFRILKPNVPTFEELGLPDPIKRLTEYSQGMVLVTGPSGSGKSTTLAALVELVNQQREEHIITIEDPVEYAFVPKGCQITQRQVGLHTNSFATALKSALREDPDVIMIGELRDLDTIALAITAADTGHLVFGTTDTTSAPRTIDRILNVFPPDERLQIRSMISDSIRGIICQQLLPRADGKGMVLALEILFNTPAVANMIRDSKLHQMEQLMQTQKSIGMVVMDNYIEALLQHGMITGEEAYYAASDPARFAQFAPVIA